MKTLLDECKPKQIQQVSTQRRPVSRCQLKRVSKSWIPSTSRKWPRLGFASHPATVLRTSPPRKIKARPARSSSIEWCLKSRHWPVARCCSQSGTSLFQAGVAAWLDSTRRFRLASPLSKSLASILSRFSTADTALIMPCRRPVMVQVTRQPFG